MNQTATWKAKASVNEYNEATYAANVSIDCRIDYKRKMVRDKQGQAIVSEATLYTSSTVKPDDVIVFDSINWTVVAVANQVGLDGTVIFYEVSL